MANIVKYNTRVQLKYDSLTEWNKVKTSFIPLKGEVCVVDPSEDLGSGSTIALLKVGDGEKTFEQLDYVCAPAADVYDWAKADSIVLTNEKLQFKKDNVVKYEVDLSYFASDAEVEAFEGRIAAVENAINAMDFTDPTASGTATQVITNISQTDGKISATKKNLPSVDDPTASGNSVTFIDTVKQVNGAIVATKKTVSGATDQAAGIVKLGVEKGAATYESVSQLSGEIATIGNKFSGDSAKRAIADGDGNNIVDTYATKTVVDELKEDIGDLSNVMNFKGVVTSDPSNITSGYNHGDVVIYLSKEYVFVDKTVDTDADKTGFVEFGDTSTQNQAIADLQGAVASHKSYATIKDASDVTTTAATINAELSIVGDGKITTAVTDNTVTISHGAPDNTAPTTVGNTTAKSPDHGESFDVIGEVKYDATGHIVSASTKTITLPEAYDDSALDGRVTELEDRVEALEETTWKTSSPVAPVAETATTDQKASLAASDLTIGETEIGYIIFDCGSATKNV